MSRKHPESPKKSENDSAMVDRLLKELRGPEDEPQAHGRPSGQITGPLVGRAHFADPVASAKEQAGTWARVVLALVVGVALTQWPYSSGCGFPLALYLLSVIIATSAGIWASMVSWKWRMSGAHIASVILVFWGVFLMAEQFLPRVGYAKVDATWKCMVDGALRR